jgi:hypothetical protein
MKPEELKRVLDELPDEAVVFFVYCGPRCIEIDYGTPTAKLLTHYHDYHSVEQIDLAGVPLQ